MRSIRLISDHMRMPDFSRKIEDQRGKKTHHIFTSPICRSFLLFNKITSLRQGSYLKKKMCLYNCLSDWRTVR